MAHSEWLSSLFALTFFQPCAIHPNARRSECNFFCVSCTPRRGAPYCRLCLEEHDASCPGPVFQIRKYMYQTCANVEDLQQLLDITNIQAYLINSKRAILLHPKAATMNTPSAVIGESLCGWVVRWGRGAGGLGVGVLGGLARQLFCAARGADMWVLSIACACLGQPC